MNDSAPVSDSMQQSSNKVANFGAFKIFRSVIENTFLVELLIVLKFRADTGRCYELPPGIVSLADDMK